MPAKSPGNQKKDNPKRNYRLDWDALKAEYLTGTMNLNALRRAHGISQTWFYQRTEGWAEERAMIRQKALDTAAGAAQAIIRDQYTAFAKNMKNILEITNAQAVAIYKETLDAEGKVTKPVKPSDLYTIVAALNTALKTFRLIEGKSTEVTEERGPEYWKALDDIVRGVEIEVPPEYAGTIPAPNGTDKP